MFSSTSNSNHIRVLRVKTKIHLTFSRFFFGVSETLIPTFQFSLISVRVAFNQEKPKKKTSKNRKHRKIGLFSISERLLLTYCVKRPAKKRTVIYAQIKSEIGGEQQKVKVGFVL